MHKNIDERSINILRGNIKSSDILSEKLMALNLMDDNTLRVATAGIIPGIPDGTGPWGDSPECPCSQDDSPMGDMQIVVDDLSDEEEMLDEEDSPEINSVLLKIENALEELKALITNPIDEDDSAIDEDKIIDEDEIIDEDGEDMLIESVASTLDDLSISSDVNVFHKAFKHLAGYKKV